MRVRPQREYLTIRGHPQQHPKPRHFLTKIELKPSHIWRRDCARTLTSCEDEPVGDTLKRPAGLPVTDYDGTVRKTRVC